MKSHSQKRKSNEMQIARGRLKGVLQDMVIASDDEEENDSDDLEHLKKSSYLPLRGSSKNYKKETVNNAGISSSPKGSKAASPNQQQRDLFSNKPQVQESFVMKLFDRSLDLSKYDEYTGLYPICRAWMANTPRSPNIISFRESTARTLTKRNIDTSNLLSRLQKGEIFDITSLPEPEKTDFPKICPIDLTENNSKTDGTSIINCIQDTQHNELLPDHIVKWKAIRSKIQKHTKQYQMLRYEKNFQIIKELLKP